MLPHTVETLAEYEQADVDEFLARYWSLTPEARQARWKELDDRCHDSEVRAALNRVSQGLSGVVRMHEDAATDELAHLIRELFVLPPREKALRRMEWCRAMVAKRDLVSLAYEFRYADPGVAALAPQLLQMMHDTYASDAATISKQSFFDPFKMLESKQTPFDLEPDREDGAIEAKTEQERELAEVASIRHAVKMYEHAIMERRAKPENSRIVQRLWIIIGIVFMVSFVGFFCLDKTKDSPNSRYRYDEPLDRTLPIWTEDNVKTSNIFTAEQIRQFKEYDPKSGKPEPKNYRLWVVFQKSDVPQTSTPTKK